MQWNRKMRVTMKRSKRLVPKKKLNLKNKNTIIKIKGNSLRSLIANPMKKWHQSHKKYKCKHLRRWWTTIITTTYRHRGPALRYSTRQRSRSKIWSICREWSINSSNNVKKVQKPTIPFMASIRYTSTLLWWRSTCHCLNIDRQEEWLLRATKQTCL